MMVNAILFVHKILKINDYRCKDIDINKCLISENEIN